MSFKVFNFSSLPNESLILPVLTSSKLAEENPGGLPPITASLLVFTTLFAFPSTTTSSTIPESSDFFK